MDDKAGGLRMAKTLYKYDGEVNKVVWFTTWNYALRNFYSDNIDFVPNPIRGQDYNTYVEFRSRRPGFVNVDWGDGNKDQIAMTYNPSGFYTVLFRSLNIEYRKNPDASTWWFRKSDGSQYVPVPPHHYEDDRKDVQRAVSLDFTCPIYQMSFNTCRFSDFPVVDLPDLEYLLIRDTGGINSIPQERLSRATKLKSIDFFSLGSTRIPILSEGITNKTLLQTLNIGACFDMSDLDASGARRLGNLKNLTNLGLQANSITKYFKELNDLPNLKVLGMAYGGEAISDEQFAEYPDMSEVTHINPSLETLTLFEAWYGGAGNSRRTRIPSSLNGMGVENLTSISLAYNRNIDYSLPFPDWIYESRSVSRFNANCCFVTVEDADRFVAGIYNATTNWEQSTMSQTARDGKRNQWYGLSVDIYDPIYHPTYKRPSGVEQAPEGFVKGQSNGSPSSAMEMVYVLKNNYAQKWDVPPK